MAQTESRIRLVFDGVEKGVVKAAEKSQVALKKLGAENDRMAVAANKSGVALGEVGIGLAKVGVAGNAMSAALSAGGGAVGALSALAPAALLLPGALLAGAAAMQTFKLATAGFGEAVGAGLSGDMEALAEATKDMHPEMAKAVGAVVKFKPRIDDLRKSVQGKFWDQFSVGLEDTGDKLLGVAEKSLPALSQELGNMAKQTVNMLGEIYAIENVETILGNTTETFRNMRPALANLVSGFLGLGAVGSTYLPRLGKAITDVTAKFKKWIDEGIENGRIKELIDGAIAGFKDLGGIVKNIGSTVSSVFRGLGGEVANPLARLRELTGQVAAFMKTASAQDGLRALGETLRVVGEVVGRVVMTALRELMPTLVELAPVAQEVARTLGDMLVNALETLGPIIRGIASVLGEFPGVVGGATVAVVAFVAAVKGMQVASGIATALSGLGTAVGVVGDKAKAADGKVAPLATRLGGLKAIGGAAALAGVALAMDDVNTAAAGGQKLQGFEDNLHDIVGAGKQVATLDFGGIFADIGEDLDMMVMKMQTGESAVGKFFGWLKRQMTEPLPPITFDVNTGPAVGQVDAFISDVNSRAPQVNINGNTNGAGFALRTILSEIAAGKESVTIDGKPMPAQEALRYVVGLINNSTGEVDINGNRVPAGQALSQFLSQANGSRGTVQVGANTAGANSSVSGFVSRWNGYTIRMNAVVSSRIGGLAAGGPVMGPGSGTSDTAGLFALSNGEYVATAKQVDAAGGPSAFGRLMGLLERGEVRHLAAGGAASPIQATAKAAMRTPTQARTGGSGGTQVTFSGNTSDALATVIMGMIRTNKIQIKAA